MADAEDDSTKKADAEAEKGSGDNAADAPASDDVRVPSTSGSMEKRTVHPARPIPFVPHGYQLGVDRRTIRRNPALSDFHDWLKVHTASGFLTRQETVSMIPPVVLNPVAGDRVLDMCAAPGSKTSQMVEALSAGGKDALDEDGEPRGLVVANDADPKRAYMLVAQLRRINAPNIYVCSCDGQQFPTLDGKRDKNKKWKEGEGKGKDAGAANGEGGAAKEEEKKDEDKDEVEGIFDKVLADVPCSGDGTTRKNPGIWRHWSQVASLGLHPLQLSILLRGARLTRVGGYVCYSTCSMNPVENEAVVAEALRRTKGALELVDRREDLGPALRARPGWSKWRVMVERGKAGMASRKERQNYEKKNNAKMQKRRAEWEEKRKKEQEEKKEGEEGEKKEEDGAKKEGEGSGDAEMADADAPTKNEDGVDEAATKKEEDGDDKKENGDDKKENGDDKKKIGDSAESNPALSDAQYLPFGQSVFKSGPPASWDTDTLIDRARQSGLEYFETYDAVPKDGNYRMRIRESCFPPTDEEAASMGLEKCMRCLPQDMDTGGFFVALFKKVGPLAGLEGSGDGGISGGGSDGKSKQKGSKRKAGDDDKAEGDKDGGKEGDKVEVEAKAEDEKKASEEEEGAPETKRRKSEGEEDKADASNGAEDSMAEEAMEVAKAADGGETPADTSAAEDSNLEAGAAKEGDDKEEAKAKVEGDKPPSEKGGDAGADEKDADQGNKPKSGRPKESLFPVPKDMRQGGRGRWPKISREDLYPVPSDLWPKLNKFYGFGPTFPVSQFMTRSTSTTSESKVVYFVSKSVKSGLIDRGVQERVLTISSGLKAFERNNKECAVNHRMCFESIQFLVPHMTAENNRLVSVSPEDFNKCISTGNLKLETFSTKFAERVRAFDQGSFAVALEGYEKNVAAKMFLVMWRCRSDATNCLVGKMEMDGMRSKLRALGHEALDPAKELAEGEKGGLLG
uniref:SAM-dependent MTase RsmB/NOP-type domain-containing protein n=1 Tax=Odontella aurita TaxID=265563 RepID=A0A7S4JKA6_9STRA